MLASLSRRLVGLFALWSFWPRRYWATNLRALREFYLGAEQQFAKLKLLDTQIEMVETLRGTLHSKAQRVKGSMVTLALAVLLTAIGLSVH
jgi:hypothetical protein